MAVAVLASAAILLGGCGGGAADARAGSAEPSGSEPSASSTTVVDPEDAPELPVTVVDDTGATVVVESAERIVPLDGDIAEVVFALGLGDRVVATDLSATYPPEADALPEFGYQRALAPEPIAAFEPTVAIASDIAGPPETIEALRDLDIPVVVLHQLDGPEGPPDKIRRVAGALGVPGRGEALAVDVETRIRAATVDPGDDAPRVAALYLRGERVQMVLGAGGGTDWIIDTAGGVDVGSEMGIEDSAPLGTEALVAADPDMFVVSTTGLASVGGLEGFLELPGIAETTAGRTRNVFARPDQYLFGSGPRSPDLLAELADALAGEPAARISDEALDA